MELCSSDFLKKRGLGKLCYRSCHRKQNQCLKNADSGYALNSQPFPVFQMMHLSNTLVLTGLFQVRNLKASWMLSAMWGVIQFWLKQMLLEMLSQNGLLISALPSPMYTNLKIIYRLSLRVFYYYYVTIYPAALKTPKRRANRCNGWT